MVHKALEYKDTILAISNWPMMAEIYRMLSSIIYLIRFYNISEGKKKLVCVKVRYEKEGYNYKDIKHEVRNMLSQEVDKNFQSSDFLSESERIKDDIELCHFLLELKTSPTASKKSLAYTLLATM